MSRDVTVPALDPQSLRAYKALCKASNPRATARAVFKAGLDALTKPAAPKAKAKAAEPKKAAKKKPGKLAASPVDMTADATTIKLD